MRVVPPVVRPTLQTTFILDENSRQMTSQQFPSRFVAVNSLIPSTSGTCHMTALCVMTMSV